MVRLRVSGLLAAGSMFVAGFTFATPRAEAQVTAAPALINFQGRLTKPDGTALANGNYNLTVSLWDAQTGGNQKWSQALTNVPVTNGLFSVALNAGTSGLFDGGLWLETQVGTDPAMAPRVQITSVPFAMKANSVPDGAIGAAQIAPGAITPEKLATGLQGWLLGGNGGTNSSLNYLGTTDGQPLILKTNGAERLRLDATGRLGLGTANPGMSLEVTAPSYYNAPAIGASSGSNWAYLHVSPNPSLIWNNGSAMRLGSELQRGNGYTEWMRITSTGNVGIGTASPGAMLHVNGGVANVGVFAGDLQPFGAAPFETNVNGNGLTHAWFAENGNRVFSVIGGDVYAKNSLSTGAGAFASSLAVGGSIPYGNITSYVQTQPNWYSLFNTDGTRTLVAWHGPVGAVDGVWFGTMSNHPLILQTNNAGQFIFTPDGKLGVGTMTPGFALDVNGTAQVKVLRIAGGADVAEPFNVQGPGTPEPGMVVSINPDQAGELRLADTAYDRTVAGVISGAGGIQPGMTLSQAGTEADGKHPVALSGRVWCYADADANGAIAPGDLLTTSTTPGHAMRATDTARRQGAILGKAMSRLKSGKGLVLVLVTLQ